MSENPYVLTVKLKQHTPIIHFQHDQQGATLRATEVKPKLDKFIIEKMGGWDTIPDDWKVGKEKAKHQALDYKLWFRGSHEPQKNEVVIIPPEQKYALFDEKEIECHIFSKNAKLLSFLKQHYRAFFVLHNFGTRQNKGWGCFAPNDMQVHEFEECLLNSGKAVYRSEDKIREGFENFYKIELTQRWRRLKSGINFPNYHKSLLFKYMASKGVRWEKRAIKKKLLELIRRSRKLPRLSGSRAPNDVTVNEAGCQDLSFYNNWKDNPRFKFNYKFVRFFLGMPEHFEFRAKGGCIYQVKITSNDVDRFKAPVTFKVFQNNLYAIAEEIPPIDFDNFRFSFTVKVKQGDDVIDDNIPLDLNLSLPKEFNLVEFLDKYFPCIGFERM